MKNIIPQTPSIISATILGNKIRIVHSSLVDYDANSIACYVFVVTKGESNYTTTNSFNTIYKVDKGEVNFFDIPMPTVDATQECVIELAVIDELTDGATGSGSGISVLNSEGTVTGTVENELITNRVASAINLSTPTRLNYSRGAYIRDIIVVSPDTISSSAPPYLTVELDADNIEENRYDSVAVQAATGYDGSTLTGLTWNTIYTGDYTKLINVSSGLVVGTDYVFRLVTTFSDGSTKTEYYDSDITTESLEHPLIEKTFSAVAGAPDGFSALSFSAYTSWDGTPTYDLLVGWTWDGTEDRLVRHFEIEYLQQNTIANGTDLTTLDWSSPVKFTVASTSDNLFIPAVAYGDRYAFRIRSVGWGDAGNKYSAWFYDKVAIGLHGGLDFDIDPANSTAPINTNIQVNDSGIYAYKDWGTGTQAQTFSVDASTGNVSIGESGEFIYDAVNSVLSIDGQAIINDITAASVVLDWLGGTAPSIRTSNKVGFADGGSGLWAGYSDSTTFQMDIGDDASYIRWDGTDLKISGGVVIDLPSDPSTLPPGSIGYTTLSLSATNNIVLFNGETNTLKEDPTVINLNVSTNGNQAFIDDLVWQVLDPDNNDVTSTLLSEQYTGAPNTAKKLTISSANGGLSSYDSLRVRVYYSPGTETWADSNIKDFTNIGKVKTYDNIAGLEEPYYAYLTNEAQPVPVDANEQNPYLADATGQFKLYQGTTDLSNNANTTYSIVNADGCTVGLSGNTYTVTAIPLTGGVPTKDTYAITIRASYDNGSEIVSYDRVFSLFISKQGQQGDPGPAGPSAQILTLSADSYVFKYDADGNVLNNSITLTANRQNIDSATNWSSSPSVTLGGTGDTRTLSATAFGSSDVVTITAESEGFSDTIRIVRVTDGGTGEDAFTVILTNEAHSIPTDVNGDNPDLTGTGTTVMVYKGAAKLQSANPASLASLQDGEYDVQISNGLTGMTETISGNDSVFSDATSGFVTDTHQVTYSVHIAVDGGSSYITLTKVQTFTKSKQGSQGPQGPVGPVGKRAPSWFEASTTQNPLNSSVWTGGTGSHAYTKLVEVAGNAEAYDMLTLYNSSTPSQTDTFMWNGASWEDAVKINGNIIADGTIGARAIVADEGFFEDISVNRIYNHGGSSGNYKMMIDFQNGAIHIRGGN